MPTDRAHIDLWPVQQPQRQDSLAAQLADLHRLAARYGMYDAADWLWKHMPVASTPTIAESENRHAAGAAYDWRDGTHQEFPPIPTTTEDEHG